MIRKLFVYLVAISLMLPLASFAGRTVLSGAVMDSQAHTIAGAVITVRKHGDSNGPVLYRQTSNNSGTWMIQNIPKGDYDITCEKSGYSPQTKEVKVEDYIAAGAYFLLDSTGPQQPTVGGDVFHLGHVDLQTARVYVAYGSDSDSNPDILQGSVAGNMDGPGNLSGQSGEFPTDSPYSTLPEMGAMLYGGSPTKNNPLMELMLHGAAKDPSQLIPATHPDSIIMVDTKDNQTVASIPTSSRPFWLAFSPDGRKFWAVDSMHNLSMFSPSGERLASVNLGDNLVSDLAVSSDGTRVFLAMRSWPDPEILVADGVSNALTGSFSLPSAHGEPGGIAAAAYSRTVVVTMGTAGAGWLEALDSATGEVTKEIQVGAQPTGVGVTPDGARAIVANYGEGSVDIVDLQSGSVIADIPTGLEPSKIAMRSDGRVAFVTNNGDNSISVIDMAQAVQLAKVPVGKGPMGIAVSQDGQRVYVANSDEGDITVIDGMTLAVLGTTTPVNGEHPFGIAIRP